MAKRKILEVDYHRNGIGGIGFHIVRFEDKDSADGEFVGVVFPESGACAVLNVPQLAKGNIAFARGNSWRGDYFEGDLRDAIKKHKRQMYKSLGMSDKEIRDAEREEAET